MKQGIIGAFSAIVLVVVSIVLAQNQATPSATDGTATQASAAPRTISGEVVELTKTMLSIRTGDGARMTFTVDRDLTTGPEAITVGKRVRVEYDGDQELRALVVAPVAAVGESRERVGEEIQEASRATAKKDDNGAEAKAQTGAGVSAARNELPATASPLPILLLAGLSLIGGGVGLSLRRR